MGDYTMVIHGTGNHKGRADKPGTGITADELLERFIKELKDSGHVVEVATITHGGREKVKAD